MNPQLGLAWYYERQWDKIRSYSKDRATMEKDYKDWERGALDAVKKFEAQGCTVNKVYVDVDMLIAWTKQKHLPINGKARADYVNHLLAERHGLNNDI